MSQTAPKKNLLLLEPDYMLRHTVALTARSTGLAEIQEAPSLKTAEEILRRSAFDGLLLALGNEDQGLELVEQLRAGQTQSAAGTAVAVMVSQCNAARAQKLRLVGVNQIILRPFKVKTLLGTIQGLSANAG